MPFNGSGQYSVPPLYNPVNPGDLVSSTAFNATMVDIAGGLSTCVTTDGQSTFSANLPMSGFGITQLGNGTAGTPAITWGGGDGFYRTAGLVGVTAGGVGGLAVRPTGVDIFTGLNLQRAGVDAFTTAWSNNSLMRFTESLSSDGSNLALGYCDDTGAFVAFSVSYNRIGQAIFAATPVFNSNLGGGFGAQVIFKNPNTGTNIAMRVNSANNLEVLNTAGNAVNFAIQDDGTALVRGSLGVSGAINVLSLAATKSDIEDFGLDQALALLQRLRPRRYKLKRDGSQHIGLVREEVPHELTSGDAVSLYDIVTVLVGAVQKLAQKVD